MLRHRRPCPLHQQTVAQKQVVFLGLALSFTCFLHLCLITKGPLILCNFPCKSSILLAKVSLTWSFWDMYLSWQNMAAAREKLYSGNELCLGIPRAAAVYIFLQGYARPPKTKLCNVILFHCITANRRKCQSLLIGPAFPAFCCILCFSSGNPPTLTSFSTCLEISLNRFRSLWQITS